MQFFAYHQITYFFDETALEILILVTMYANWKPIVGKQSIPQGLSHDPGYLGSSFNCLHISHEVVSNDQYIYFLSSLRIFNCQEIYVDQL